MDEKQYRKLVRRDFGRQGWTLLIFYGIMNVAVIFTMMIDLVIRSVEVIVDQGLDAFETNYDAIAEQAGGNAWGYMLAYGVGFLILFLWKGRKFLFSDLWCKGKPMHATDFFPILCIFVSAQVLFQLLATVIELVLNLFGLSAMAALESATLLSDSFSMFLYAGILAPIGEEILFRGLILQGLRPYGNKTAIFVSALLFGLFHGNLTQTPFAFAVGLVLGFVAGEYSLLWAMVLHMFNNLIISDFLNRLTFGFNEIVGNVVSVLVIYGFAVGGIVVAIKKRKAIAVYLRRERMKPYHLRCCFTSAGFIALAVVMLLNMLLGITRL